jgi:hypothetical protein
LLQATSICSALNPSATRSVHCTAAVSAACRKVHALHGSVALSFSSYF